MTMTTSPHPYCRQPRSTLCRVLAIGLLLGLAIGCSSESEKPDAGQTSDAAAAQNSADELDTNAGGPDQQTAPPAANPGGSEKSLYDRIGGKDFLTQFANKFVDAMAASPRITKNPKVAKAMKGDLSAFKTGFADYLCQVSGGPCKYSGKPLKDAHKGLGITADEWKAMGGIFIKTLTSMGIQPTERRELANLTSMTKYDITGQ